MRVEYLILMYSTDVYAKAGQRIAVVYRQLSSVPTEIHCLVKNKWATGIPKKNSIYIDKVLTNFTSENTEVHLETWTGFETASTGLLRVECSGICEDSEVADLLTMRTA